MAISLRDAGAGSPPTAGELLWRYRWDKSGDALAELLREWERWAADVLESHLSYPALAYFRSQHYNQSWLAALTTMLDASALVMVGLEGGCVEQARLTFAMARHAVVDLAQVFNTPPRQPAQRLSEAEFSRLHARLVEAGLKWRETGGAGGAAPPPVGPPGPHQPDGAAPAPPPPGTPPPPAPPGGAPPPPPT